MPPAVTGSAAVAGRRLVYPLGVVEALKERASTVTHPHAIRTVGTRFRARRFVPRKSDWSRATIGRDLSAGLMVALVALPLALGFGVASGVGAAAGITTAIVAGILAAVFGGSNVQVSGPTGAMTVVLIPIVATCGAAKRSARRVAPLMDRTGFGVAPTCLRLSSDATGIR